MRREASRTGIGQDLCRFKVTLPGWGDLPFEPSPPGPLSRPLPPTHTGRGGKVSQNRSGSWPSQREQRNLSWTNLNKLFPLSRCGWEGGVGRGGQGVRLRRAYRPPGKTVLETYFANVYVNSVVIGFP